MGRLTKAGFAASKRALRLKGKLTRKQVQRVFKHAIKKLGRTRRRVSKKGKVYYTKPKKSNPKRRKTRMVRRRKRRRGGKSMTKTAFKMIRLGALAANPVYQMMRTDRTNEQKIDNIFSGFTGFSVLQGNFVWSRLASGWMPYIIACAATYGIPKLTSIIRRL